jgi:hypothetical protein
MGGAWSSEPKTPVDLLPPRFDRRSSSLERCVFPETCPPCHHVGVLVKLSCSIPKSPFEYMFGQEKRDVLFGSYFAQADTLTFQGAVRPDYDEKAIVGFSTKIPVGVAATSLPNARIMDSTNVMLGYEDQAESPAFMVQARVATEGAVRAVASVFDVNRGLGGYALIPLEFFGQMNSADMPIASGLSGTAARYTELSPAATKWGLASVVPELGLRYISPTERYSFGVHSSPFQPYPTKAWIVGTVNGAVTAGMQLCSDLSSMKTERAEDVTVDAAISLQQHPLYELSLAFDGRKQEVVAGYIHNMTLRRRVYNVMEETHVKGIYNYMDWGFELRRPLRGTGSPSLAVGAAWQVNKNLLFKGRIGTQDASMSACFKSWWDPAATFCVTSSYNRMTNQSGIGLYLTLERGGDLQYQKSIQGYQSSGKSKVLIAQEHVNEKVSRSIDTHPYDPPPVVTLRTSAGALPNRLL